LALGVHFPERCALAAGDWAEAGRAADRVSTKSASAHERRENAFILAESPRLSTVRFAEVAGWSTSQPAHGSDTRAVAEEYFEQRHENSERGVRYVVGGFTRECLVGDDGDDDASRA